MAQARQLRAERTHSRAVSFYALHASTMLVASLPPAISDGDGNDGSVSQDVAQTFVARKPEEFVLDDASARRGAKLLECRRRYRIDARGAEGIARIGGLGVPSKGVGRAVKAVRAGLDADVDDRAFLPAIFRLGILLGVEFLDGVDGQNGAGISAAVSAIERRRANRLADRGDALSTVRTSKPSRAGRWCSASGGASHGRNHAGTQLQQALEVAAIQGQGVDGLIADGTAQGGIGGVDRGNFSGDGDRLGLLARLHHQVHANILTDLHKHAVVLHGAETLGLGANRIRAWTQAGGHVLTGVVGDERRVTPRATSITDTVAPATAPPL